MNWRTVTLIGICLFTLGIILFDVVMLIIGGDSATVSAVVYNASREHPVISFALGFLMGHLAWPQTERTRGELPK